MLSNIKSILRFSCNLYNVINICNFNSSFVVSPLAIPGALKNYSFSADKCIALNIDSFLGCKDNGKKFELEYKGLMEHLVFEIYSRSASLRFKSLFEVCIFFKNKNECTKSKKIPFSNTFSFLVLFGDLSSSKPLLTTFNGVPYRGAGNFYENCFKSLDPNVNIFLASNCFISGYWLNSFVKSLVPEEFIGCTTKIDVHMLHRQDVFNVYQNEYFTSVQIRFMKKEFSFIGILPQEGVSLSEVNNYLLESRFIENITSLMKPTKLDLKIPQFAIKSNIDIKNVLLEVDQNNTNSDLKSMLENCDLKNFPGLFQVLEFRFCKDGVNISDMNTCSTGMKESLEDEDLLVHFNRSFLFVVVRESRYNEKNYHLPLIMGTYTGSINE